jgi:ubiquitin-protein ligase
MSESPRTRRLRSDLRALEQLQAESSILRFDANATFDGVPEAYVLRFQGAGAWRPVVSGDVLLRDMHELTIRLGANYPRMMPELSWKSPIFHPNISSSGFVCLGGYGTFWAPSLHLDELCNMLWDMIRYENYDVNSPYNREAALWAKTQQTFQFPLDRRALRDLHGIRSAESKPPVLTTPPLSTPTRPDIIFLDDVVEAEVVPADEADFLVIR